MLWFQAIDDEVSILYKRAAYVVIDGFKPVKFVVGADTLIFAEYFHLLTSVRIFL